MPHPLCLLIGLSLLAAPTTYAQSAPADRRALLAQTIDAVLASPPLSTGQVGVQVSSVTTGELLYGRNADKLLNPASNVKLVTSTAALSRLGPEYRFATDFACVPALTAAGRCEKLYVKGRGDPSLVTERLYGVAGELYHHGLRQVGDVVVDDSWFDTVREGPGWEQEHGDRAYMAPAGALSVNHNSVAIYVLSGDGPQGKARVELEPASDHIVVENRLQTARSKRARVILSGQAAGEKHKLVVSGQVPPGRAPQLFYRRILQPDHYAGETLRYLLQQRGVNIRGKVRAGTLPDGATPFHTALSRPLAELVRDLNKVSNNFVAEQLLKNLGAEMRGAPGSWAKGVSAAEDYLQELGIPRGTYQLRNGSGLNDTNRFSAAQLVQVLRAAARAPFAPDFASSLSIAGRDGTLHARMEGTPADNRLRGKTGTLENVTSLAGLVTLPSGEQWAFAVLANDCAARHGAVVAAVDRIAVAVASGGVAPTPAGAAALTAELRSRAETYLAHGRTRDAKGLAKLRQAVRSEPDPTLRAVAADVLGRLQPDNALPLALEHAPEAGDGFSRLMSLARELHAPVPLIGPLLDGAADGSSEALDRILLVAGLAKGNNALEETLSEGLEQAGRQAPGPLSEALSRADSGSRDAAVTLAARGIAKQSDAAAHPLVEQLRGASVARNRTATTAAMISDRLQRELERLRGR